jgi:uncharacterized membrane-anchored protein
MKSYLWILFLAMCGAQWFVPGYMISEQEDIHKTGKTFRFKTEPVDPSDPFRGKYITLRFEADTFATQMSNDYEEDEKVFVLLNENKKGFAQIANISKTEPEYGADYVTASVGFTSAGRVRVNYPFERFYLEESKAAPGEQVYREATANDSTQTAYAVVHVKNGKAALADVMINDRSIVDLVRGLNASEGESR